MTWWCSALNEPWTWTWRAYPGIWLLVLAGVVAYVRGATAATSRERVLFALGMLALWAGADWPLGTLSAGYLLTARVLQYILFVLVGPPLVLLGMPAATLRRIIAVRPLGWIARVCTRPLPPLLVFNGVMVLTHLPTVVDGATASPLGTFGLDLLMVASGFVFWWPALARLPELGPLTYPGRIGYLLLSVFLPTVPASFFTFSRYPIYALYELAPRVHGIGAVSDQRVAGLLMKMGGGILLFTVMSVMFFRWYARDERRVPSTEVGT